jgi:hypothetical protein
MVVVSPLHVECLTVKFHAHNTGGMPLLGSPPPHEVEISVVVVVVVTVGRCHAAAMLASSY